MLWLLAYCTIPGAKCSRTVAKRIVQTGFGVAISIVIEPRSGRTTNNIEVYHEMGNYLCDVNMFIQPSDFALFEGNKRDMALFGAGMRFCKKNYMTALQKQEKKCRKMFRD